MEFLYSPAVVSSIISLACIIITAILKDKFGETEGDRMVKVGQASMRLAQMIIEAAEFAVVEVEKSLKESGEMTNEQLKEAAVNIAAELLATWGITVNKQLIQSLFAVVEAAYQRLKKTEFVA